MRESPNLLQKRGSPLSGFLERLRVRHVMQHVTGDVLDIGCGRAKLASTLESEASISSYTGAEFGSESVARLAVTFPMHRFVQVDLDSAHWQLDGKFDTAVCLAVIEHIWNQANFFRNAIDVLKPGGRLVLTTPSVFGNDVVLALAAAMRLVNREIVDDHIVIYNKRRVLHAAREFGLRLIVYRRFLFGMNQLIVFEKGPQ